MNNIKKESAVEMLLLIKNALGETEFKEVVSETIVNKNNKIKKPLKTVYFDPIYYLSEEIQGRYEKMGISLQPRLIKKV